MTWFCSPLQLALGQGARRLHVAAALRAKAKVAVSRFEPTAYVSYETLRSSIDTVRRRSVCCSPRLLPVSGFMFSALLILVICACAVCFLYPGLNRHDTCRISCSGQIACTQETKSVRLCILIQTTFQTSRLSFFVSVFTCLLPSVTE